MAAGGHDVAASGTGFLETLVDHLADELRRAILQAVELVEAPDQAHLVPHTPLDLGQTDVATHFQRGSCSRQSVRLPQFQRAQQALPRRHGHAHLTFRAQP